jgi:hypothetical protein
MNTQNNYNFHRAETALAVANTPLFLLRKLRSDPVVVEIARDVSDEELLDALRVVTQEEPQNIQEAVLPYVYLVALSVKGNLTILKQASDVDAPHARWFKYISKFLLQSFIPTQRSTVPIITPPTAFTSSTSSSVLTSVSNVKLTGSR